jgi:hypothetical protein
VIGAAVLKISERPAGRAVLWEGGSILSDFDAKPPAKSSQDGSGKGGSGKSGKPARLGEVGRLLSDTYGDTLKEDIPDDILDLLGKLD